MEALNLRSFSISKRVNMLSTLKLTLQFYIVMSLTLISISAFAHCDSYDGPVILDAEKALENNDVNLVLKWVQPSQEKEIIDLFTKTYKRKSEDPVVYQVLKKYFFETVVRLHRETEGAPYTGLKPAGLTKKIVQLGDQSIKTSDLNSLLEKLENHMDQVLQEKFSDVASLYQLKDTSLTNGRAYVHAYVDYIHTLEAIHDILDSGIEVSHGH